MAGFYLTIASTIMCPHGGQAILVSANAKVAAAGAPVLLASDTCVVVGCPFTVGLKYQPCVTIEWSAGTAKGGPNGAPALTQASIGLCKSAEGIPQGVAIVANTQPSVSGT
jgi:hypothetical protein